jgi:hypothetical protein
MRSAKGAALAGAVIAPMTLGLLVALPFLASLMLPRGDAPAPATELLVDWWFRSKIVGAVLWGASLAWLTRRSGVRLALAGLAGMLVGEAIVFGPVSSALAPLFVDRPPHVEMAATFPIAAATTVAVIGLAFAIAADERRRIVVLSLAAPAAAAIAVVLAVALLDAIGVRTGTGALAMPKVFVLGTLAATAVMGAIQASALSRAGG